MGGNDFFLRYSGGRGSRADGQGAGNNRNEVYTKELKLTGDAIWMMMASKKLWRGSRGPAEKLHLYLVYCTHILR